MSKNECMKDMNVEMHPDLLGQWYCADVTREVNRSGARVVSAADLCHPALVMWSRGLHKQQCGGALYVLSAEEVSGLVQERTLSAHVAELRELVNVHTLLVFGTKEYCRRNSSRQTANSNRKMAEIDLEMAITDLLVSTDCDAVLVQTPNELALRVVQFTKALAEMPQKMAKRECDEKAAFYMRGDNKKCVAVDKNGNGSGRLWQQMIAILPMSSLETSRALCAQYTTPRALYDALQTPEGEKEIADIGVARAMGPDVMTRRIGPEFARKLQILFTAEDGNVLLD